MRLVEPPPALLHLASIAELVRGRGPGEIDECGVGPVAKLEQLCVDDGDRTATGQVSQRSVGPGRG
jgi:hypothetical protein